MNEEKAVDVLETLLRYTATDADYAYDTADGGVELVPGQDIADAIIVAIAAIREKKERRWIPVTERLPENDYGKNWKDRARYNVIVNGVVSTATFGFMDRNWWVDHRGYVFDKEHYNEVTHWQPAPEPLKEGEK